MSKLIYKWLPVIAFMQKQVAKLQKNKGVRG
ncbi:hypothetical protein SAMN05192529_11484 [Arachidicoccus rhizosphaerae]|uniref:Uncharacterized protein n=1 Tax=Arachidicoccus rhizosphaerae TaxID=551991 RepID=A0A1H4AGA7_9BACT|nr:hypothetical protein SAMN05192529_11484 [Arachidicoccus rhizosphaerae]